MMPMPRALALLLLGALALFPLPAGAETEAAIDDEAEAHQGVAFEVNVLWPFFPGGMTDLKLLVPVANTETLNWRGELVLGVHSDFGWRFVRDDDAGRVAILAAKLGYRQFFVEGIHLDLTVNAGWRHEEGNPWDGEDIDAFQGRLWSFAGWQTSLGSAAYVNIRAGVGLHLWRTDRFADKEKTLTVAGDVNVGFRF